MSTTVQGRAQSFIYLCMFGPPLRPKALKQKDTPERQSFIMPISYINSHTSYTGAFPVLTFRFAKCYRNISPFFGFLKSNLNLIYQLNSRGTIMKIDHFKTLL